MNSEIALSAEQMKARTPSDNVASVPSPFRSAEVDEVKMAAHGDSRERTWKDGLEGVRNWLKKWNGYFRTIRRHPIKGPKKVWTQVVHDLWFLKNRKEICRTQDAEFEKLKPISDFVVVFIVPADILINGGIMSIYQMASSSREIVPDTTVLVSTPPGSPDTYVKNPWFPNNETVFRWNLAIRALENCKKVVLNLPEYLAPEIYSELTSHDKRILQTVDDLHVNILNQAILAMPTKEKILPWKNLTTHLSQTTAHVKYANQECCDYFNLPTLWVGTWCDYSKFKRYSFNEKEKTIVYSPDKNKWKSRILACLEEGLPDFKFVEVTNMPFTEYIDLISRSFATITFGEGMDAYFTQPNRLGSVGFTVLNNDYFPPSQNWRSVFSVFDSYEEMYEKIVPAIRTLQKDEKLYLDNGECVTRMANADYGGLEERYRRYLAALKRLYDNDFEYYPRKM